MIFVLLEAIYFRNRFLVLKNDSFCKKQKKNVVCFVRVMSYESMGKIVVSFYLKLILRPSFAPPPRLLNPQTFLVVFARISFDKFIFICLLYHDNWWNKNTIYLIEWKANVFYSPSHSPNMFSLRCQWGNELNERNLIALLSQQKTSIVWKFFYTMLPFCVNVRLK